MCLRIIILPHHLDAAGRLAADGHVEENNWVRHGGSWCFLTEMASVRAWSSRVAQQGAKPKVSESGRVPGGLEKIRHSRTRHTARCQRGLHQCWTGVASLGLVDFDSRLHANVYSSSARVRPHRVPRSALRVMIGMAVGPVTRHRPDHCRHWSRDVAPLVAPWFVDTCTTFSGATSVSAAFLVPQTTKLRICVAKDCRRQKAVEIANELQRIVPAGVRDRGLRLVNGRPGS